MLVSQLYLQIITFLILHSFNVVKLSNISKIYKESFSKKVT